MAKFIRITTSELKSTHINRLKSSASENTDSLLNPIVEEFANLEIVNESGSKISFFDLSDSDREIFLDQWVTACAADMTPKLNDSIIGKELEEYIQIQNDAFDEVMAELGNSDTSNLKISFFRLSSNELYNMISSRVVERIKQKSEAYASELLQKKPELSNKLKGSTSYPDYVDPNRVLEQLRNHADRGNILINLPGTVWLSAYLFYFDPLAITKYIGIGKYPPGHVSIVLQSKTAINNIDAMISSQNGQGVIKEDISSYWVCKSHLCYVKKRVWQWRGFKSGFKTVYPDADKVIEYAESQIGKPYCTGWDFVTAKSRINCFICTTITWRSFDRKGFNIHRLLARWMPTIAPADIYLSDHVVEKHKIE